jgi:hypothetical protein
VAAETCSFCTRCGPGSPGERGPGERYPFPWAVYTWLNGETATAERIADESRLAADLARFIAALQRINPSEGPSPGEHNSFRGEPLAGRDEATRNAISSLGRAIDGDAVTEPWERRNGTPLPSGSTVTSMRAISWSRTVGSAGTSTSRILFQGFRAMIGPRPGRALLEWADRSFFNVDLGDRQSTVLGEPATVRFLAGPRRALRPARSR